MGYKGKKEVAYLNRGAFNPLNGEIYDALRAQDFNNGCSGNGEKKIFTATQLQGALDHINERNSKGQLDPEKKFLEDCLANLDSAGCVEIRFY